MRAREDRCLLPTVIDVHTPPSLELLLAYAHVRLHYFDDAFTREWHRVMSVELMWCYPKTGRPILHWPAYFREWRANRRFFEVLRDPRRLMSPAMLKSAEADEAEARRRAEEDARRAAAAATPGAWELCAERCANFRDGRCSCGVAVPPALQPRKCPPEECPYFEKDPLALTLQRGKGLPAVVGEAAKAGCAR